MATRLSVWRHISASMQFSAMDDCMRSEGGIETHDTILKHGHLASGINVSDNDGFPSDE